MSVFSIPAPHFWRYNTCWAGLFIAVANEFAPGNAKSFSDKIRAVKDICGMREFAEAVGTYVPKDLSRNKAVVAALIRAKLYLPLGILYTVKNTKKG